MTLLANSHTFSAVPRLERLAFAFVLAMGCGKPGRGDFLASFPSTASSPSAIIAVVADESGVYFLEVGVGNAEIDRVSPEGGTPTRLSPVNVDTGPQSLLLTTDALIWSDGRTIKTLPKSGGTPQPLASPESGVFKLIRDATNLYWIAADPVHPTPASIQAMPIGGGPIVTVFSTTTTRPDSIAVDETNVYFVEALSMSTSSNARIAALRKNGGGDVTLATTNHYGCCLQLGNRRLFWRGSEDGIHPAVMTLDLDSRTQAVFAPVGNGDEFRLVADGAGVFFTSTECGNKYDSPRCWTWLRRLPSNEGIAYTEHFISALTLDARYVYWTPGNNELWRVRR